MRRLIVTGTFAAALLIGTAQAHVVFTLGNHPQPNEQNILFEAPETNTTLDHAEVDHSGAGVTFDSLTGQTLTQQAEGQADIFCATNCVDNGVNKSSQLSSIEMRAGLSANGNPTAWTDAIINLDFGIGTALVTVTDNLGNTFDEVLGPGQNFLTMVAIGGQFITDIQVVQEPTTTGAFGFNSFKQPRVSGLCELVDGGCTTIPVPEPTTLALFGTGLLGLGVLRRKR
jgi:hypothetical protein